MSSRQHDNRPFYQREVNRIQAISGGTSTKKLIGACMFLIGTLIFALSFIIILSNLMLGIVICILGLIIWITGFMLLFKGRFHLGISHQNKKKKGGEQKGERERRERIREEVTQLVKKKEEYIINAELALNNQDFIASANYYDQAARVASKLGDKDYFLTYSTQAEDIRKLAKELELKREPDK